MSLINQMLKDLEKRRSRDLETSSTLGPNITWETRPNQKSFNWLAASIVFTLVLLLGVISYLLWERTSAGSQASMVSKAVSVKKIKNKKPPIVKKKTKRVIKQAVVKNTIAQSDHSAAIDYEKTIDVDEIDDAPEVKLKKKHRPLNNKQLAEIAYTKGYKFLQQGRMHQGKEYLRKALSLYIPHIKAREMLAGVYIKSGRFISAGELLSEGVKIAPEYPLFAKLYARVLLEQKNPQLAIKILEQGSTTIKVKPDYYALLAATYQRVKKHKKAVEIYLQLVKAHPATGVWWLGLGISLEKLAKKKEALEAYKRAQKTGNLKVGLTNFINNRVSALMEIGFPEE